ncbi:vomeronasal type-1 receptor 1-like [Artibeus jamaicensis]|uniref:vomeronasal type-1 receptor 1-like n=1 Tax=Artibeus jamaicensis TaxID=9417 RepID=UPI00235AA616|nr:vomeronasal type-1 receptor 1-like [Artibeus jamaicensis]
MGSASLEKGFVFLLETGAGILGNSSLLCLYNFSWLTGHKLKPIDLILNQLVFANNLVLYSKGIPHTMAAFGLKYFLDDVGCKLVFYLHRVARGVSLGTACLLSGFQAIKLYSRTYRWLEHKTRSPKCITFCCSLCWILHLLTNVFIPMQVFGPTNSKNVSAKTHFGYCFSLRSDRLIVLLLGVVLSSFDVICLVLMMWTSGSMVFFLIRHKQRVQHIHSNLFPHRPSHEVRATRIILILVSSFVTFYSLSSISTLYIILTVSPSQWLVDIPVFLDSCFPTFSPFLLIISNIHSSQLVLNFWAKISCKANLVKNL